VADERPDDEQLAAWRSLIHAHARIVELLEDDLQRGHDMPASWYDVLLKLNEAGGSLRMQELADAVLLSKSGLTRLVDRMVKAGLVDREACPSDRRGTLAVLTPAGKTRLREAAPTHLRGVQENFGRLVSKDEARVLREVFDRLFAEADQRRPATPRGS
jgi:DNA-binding MarR family transcriptional regulator